MNTDIYIIHKNRVAAIILRCWKCWHLHLYKSYNIKRKFIIFSQVANLIHHPLSISILKVAQLLIAVVPLFCGCSDSDAASALVLALYDQKHYFGLGPIPIPKSKLANTFWVDTETKFQGKKSHLNHICCQTLNISRFFVVIIGMK